MKNIYKYILFICLSIALIMSCTTNEYEEPENTTAGRTFAFSSLDKGFKGGVIDTRVNDSVDFKDLSILSNGRLWTFTEGAFDILGSSNDATSTLKELSATFKREGEAQVILAPNFANPIPEEIATDTIFFNILPGIIANFTTDITVVGGEFQIEAGEIGTFTNTSSELESADWLVTNTTNGNVEPTASTIDFSFRFKALGDYTVRLRAFTEIPFSQDFTTIKVKVVPSTKPVTVEPKIVENENGEIVIEYSRDLDPDTLDDISNFTLNVDGAPAGIASVGLDPANPANLLVTPSINIKNTQTATIAYNAVNLRSADAAPAPSVPETDIEIFVINLFAPGGFEGVTTEEYVVTSDFQGAGNRAAIDASFPDGVGVDNSRALVYTVTGAAAGDRRAIFGDKQKDTDESRVQLITPLQNGITYTVRAMIKFTGVKPTSFELGVVNFRFIGPSLVYANLDISSVVEGADFVEVEGAFTAQNLEAAGRAYPIPRLTAGTGNSVITVDNIVVFEPE